MTAVQQPLQLGPQVVVPSLSIGVALSAPDSDADAVLAQADRALYLAKATGRSQWRLAQAGTPGADG
jgi:PleD family two-component response regulator